MRGYNQFAYCFNNPVNMTDASGNWPKWLKDSVKVEWGTTVTLPYTKFNVFDGARKVYNKIMEW